MPANGTIDIGTGTLQIGASYFGENFQGLIDEVRIYNRALTATEIQTVYQQAGYQLTFRLRDFKFGRTFGDRRLFRYQHDQLQLWPAVAVKRYLSASPVFLPALRHLLLQRLALCPAQRY